MTTKILVVDDEPAIGKLLLYQLRQCGYQVTYEPDGLRALQRVSHERPDLILLDVMLPTISGWEICRQVRGSSTVPIIMLTAKNADLDIVTGLSAGADDYIAKPFSLVQLQARIEAVLRRSGEGLARRRADALHEGRADLAARRHTPPGGSEATVRRGVPAGEPTARRHTPPGGAAIALAAQLADAPPVSQAAPDEPAIGPPVALVAEPARRLGPRLRHERMARGLSLSQVEHDCHVRWEFLQAIEQENFSYVPRAQLRSAINAYATYLGMDVRAAIQHPQQRAQPTLHYAALAAMLLVLLAIGLYLLRLS